MKTLLDYPKGVARVVDALAKLRARGFEAAHYATLAALLDQSVNHVKASVAEAARAELVTVSEGGGRGKKAAVMLTEKGAALVPLASESGSRS